MGFTNLKHKHLITFVNFILVFFSFFFHRNTEFILIRIQKSRRKYWWPHYSRIPWHHQHHRFGRRVCRLSRANGSPPVDDNTSWRSEGIVNEICRRFGMHPIFLYVFPWFRSFLSQDFVEQEERESNDKFDEEINVLENWPNVGRAHETGGILLQVWGI